MAAACALCSGACRRFQPTYERVSEFFFKRGELQPKVAVARVNCAVQVWRQREGQQVGGDYC
jgi:hypothetical protein